MEGSSNDVDLNVTTARQHIGSIKPPVWGLLDKTQAKLSATLPNRFQRESQN